MKIRALLSLARLMFVAALSSTAIADSRHLTICNKDKQTKKFALIYVNQKILSWTMEAKGWFVLPTGCMQALSSNSNVDTNVFLSWASVFQNGTEIMGRFTMDASSVNTWRAGISGAERFFCVKDSNFKRVEKSWDDHEVCPEGYYHKLFNVYITWPGATNFTVNLN